jgi:hypothetical protein
MSTGAIIKPSADLSRYFAELAAAFDLVGRRKANRMNVARRKRGSKTGPKPRFTEADYAKALPVWLSAKTQPEFVLGVEKALGRTMSYSQAFRRAAGFPDKDGNPTVPLWPPRGSGKMPRPARKRRKRRRVK